MSLDTRVRYTKMIIRNSIFALIQEKPFHRITLTEVCKRAEINRSTFYKYYRDMHDWKEQAEQECIQHTIDILNTSKLEDIPKLLTRQFQSIKDHADLYTLVASPNFESNVLELIVSMTINRLDMETKKWASPATNDYHRRLDCYYTIYGCIGIVKCWIEDGMQEPPATVAAYYYEHLRQLLQTQN